MLKQLTTAPPVQRAFVTLRQSAVTNTGIRISALQAQLDFGAAIA